MFEIPELGFELQCLSSNNPIYYALDHAAIDASNILTANYEKARSLAHKVWMQGILEENANYELCSSWQSTC